MKPQVIGAFGGRGTGKSAWVLQQLEAMNPPRSAVWDFKQDPRLDGWGQAFTDPATLVRAMDAPRFRVRYLVNVEGDVDSQFDTFCRACWLAGNMVLFVDELPAVTRANKAPPAWKQIINIGREYRGADGKVRHLSVIAAAQRPSEVDKTFFDNADVIHTGRVRGASARTLADEMGVPPQQVMGLPDLHWLETRQGVPEVMRGVLSFGSKKTPARAPARKKT